jgi:hypothetical protein
MTLGLCYWILMLIWFVFGLLVHFGPVLTPAYGAVVNVLLLFVLFLILGWQIFGPPLRRGGGTP